MKIILGTLFIFVLGSAGYFIFEPGPEEPPAEEPPAAGGVAEPAASLNGSRKTFSVSDEQQAPPPVQDEQREPFVYQLLAQFTDVVQAAEYEPVAIPHLTGQPCGQDFRSADGHSVQ